MSFSMSCMVHSGSRSSTYDPGITRFAWHRKIFTKLLFARTKGTTSF
ncbi:hypothetical protein A2U01_0115754, partial [Trifolium medium]|nr:hypothetical protein [Trifolium medium]